jgi:purine-nucleoside/S-methyl-5'-thioadenosine phosphorylase / adenosine deaminase
MAIKKSSPRKRSRSTSGKKKVAAPGPGPATPWLFHRSQGLQLLQLAPFRKLRWLVHGFSTRAGGVSTLDGNKVLNLSFMDWDTRENVLKNRKLLQAAAGASDLNFVPLMQIHSDVIHTFSSHPDEPRKGDASATNQTGLLLAVQTADCVPILLVDPKKRAVAAIHAGWRGTLARIAQKAVGRLQMEFGSKPSDLLAALGPSIGPCCYEVGAELVTKFTVQFADGDDYFDEARSGEEPNPLQWLNMAPPGHQPPAKNVHLDLRRANQSQLIAAGLQRKNIFVSNLCTACRTDLLFSYRREGPQSGRLLSIIGIAE